MIFFFMLLVGVEFLISLMLDTSSGVIDVWLSFGIVFWDHPL